MGFLLAQANLTSNDLEILNLMIFQTAESPKRLEIGYSDLERSKCKSQMTSNLSGQQAAVLVLYLKPFVLPKPIHMPNFKSLSPTILT